MNPFVLKERYTPLLRPVRDRAVELIQDWGWTKGAYMRDENGNNLGSPEGADLNWDHFPTTGIDCVCLEGAVIVACQEKDIDPYSMMHLFSEVWQEASGKMCAMSVFNDSNETNLDDVIQSLHKMEPLI